MQETEGTKISKIANRINALEKLNFKIIFDRIQSKTLQRNLMLIDSRLHEILAYLVYQKYKTSKSNLAELLPLIQKENPLNYDLAENHPFYDYKIKNFLTDCALGMTPETIWKGKVDATGGIIAVKETGDLVCYHIFNKNEFQDHLVNNTRLEQPSTSEDKENPGNAVQDKKAKPYKFGWIYEENNEFFLKLNLQIRFK